MKEKICIVDYGSGNQKSLFNLISYMNFDVKISCELNDIKNYEWDDLSLEDEHYYF
jgi:imidazoleglycerol phosphate synthase glutamine amidotransferase subunit HisH